MLGWLVPGWCVGAGRRVQGRVWPGVGPPQDRLAPPQHLTTSGRCDNNCAPMHTSGCRFALVMCDQSAFKAMGSCADVAPSNCSSRHPPQADSKNRVTLRSRQPSGPDSQQTPTGTLIPGVFAAVLVLAVDACADGLPDTATDQTTSSAAADVPPETGGRIRFFTACSDDRDFGELTAWTAPSPNGTKVAFYRPDATGDWELFVADVGGADPTRIASTRRPIYPAWSPDGTRLAFSNDLSDSDFEDSNFEIFIARADDSGTQQLTGESPWDDLISSIWGASYLGSWSPDGTRIAFSRDFGASASEDIPDDFTKVFVIDSDGANERQLITANDSQDWTPAWSPDGTRIAFFSQREDQVAISVVDADGMNLSELVTTGNEIQDFSPAWSPDGTRLTFYVSQGEAQVITVMDADGSNIRLLTENGSVSNDLEYPLVWSPDSTQIAFVEIRDDDAEIFVIDADGTDILQLTDNNTDDWPISWS